MAVVARLTAAADARAHASAPGARQRHMLQAERALWATASPQQAAALQGRGRDASRRRPWGNLLMHFFTLGNSKNEVFETCCFDTVIA